MGRGCSESGVSSTGSPDSGSPGATRTWEAGKTQQVRTPVGAGRLQAATEGRRVADSVQVVSPSCPESEHLGTQAQPSLLPLPPSLEGSAPPLLLQFWQSDLRVCPEVPQEEVAMGAPEEGGLGGGGLVGG